jgi:hypothetical protein
MLRGRGNFLARLGASSEFKYQAVLTIKVVTVMLVIFGGLRVADLFLAP